MKHPIINWGFVFALGASANAHAYLDPGTGSMALQMLIASVVAGFFVIKTYYYELKRRIQRLFGGDSESDGVSESRTEDTSSASSQTNQQ